MRIPKAKFSFSASRLSPGSLLLVPGVFFVLLGIVALVAPRFILALIAGFALFVGALLCLVAFKIAQFQRKFARMARDLEGRIVVHGVNVVPSNEMGPPDIDVEPTSKKIIYH
jgi:membrane protein implicated in regulation of membrane protease activity